MRECAAEQQTSSWLQARVAKGLRAAPLRQFRRANYGKLWQSGRVPGSSVSIGRSCRNFACWLPKIGLLLGIFHAPRTENAPYGYERFGAPSENPPYGYARKKKKPSTDDGQLFIKVALRSNVLNRFFFAFLAPKPALEPSPGLPRLRDTPRHSGAGPETSCFLFHHVYPIKLLEAAELREVGWLSPLFFLWLTSW